MLLDANEETFELVEIDGKETLFTTAGLTEPQYQKVCFVMTSGNQKVSAVNR